MMLSSNLSLSIPSASCLLTETSLLPSGWFVSWSTSTNRRVYSRRRNEHRLISEVKQFKPPELKDAIDKNEFGVGLTNGQVERNNVINKSTDNSQNSFIHSDRQILINSHDNLKRKFDPPSDNYSRKPDEKRLVRQKPNDVAISIPISNSLQYEKVVAFARLVVSVNVYNSTDISSLSLPLPQPVMREYHEDSPLLLYKRKIAFTHLDRYLTSTCHSRGLPSPPANSFQRWGFAQRSIQLGGCDRTVDPLLPLNPQDVDRALEWELIRAGAAEPKAKEVCTLLAQECRKEALKLMEFRKKEEAEEQRGLLFKSIWESQYFDDCISITIPNAHPSSQVSVNFVATNGSEFRDLQYVILLNVAHYHKLYSWYSKHTQPLPPITSDPHLADILDASFILFKRRLFSLLAHYDTISGAGYQAAVPSAVFETFTKHFDTQHECFASPLNCYLPSYCSAFPNVDRFFGSLGSFYDMRVEEGSYECNPPFLEEVMTPNAMHLIALLHLAQSKGKSLMFIVIWPAWNDTPAYDILIQSPFFKYLLVLDEKEHHYKEGFQHKTKSIYRLSGAKSNIFFIQTKEAQNQWPVTSEIIDEIKSKFFLRQ